MQTLPLATLKAIGWNPRQISKRAADLLLRSLREHTAALPDWNPDAGIRLASPITVNRQGNRIIGGHQRIAALQQAGQDWVHTDDVHWVDLPPESSLEKSLVVQLNNKDAQGEFVDSLLDEVLGSIRDEAPDLLQNLGLDSLLKEKKKSKKEVTLPTVLQVIVDCEDEETQQDLYEELVERGLTVRIINF